jgi:ribosome-interacting GTPase 1
MSLDLYFDQALTMEQGDTLMIPCDDKREQESLRVRLYQLRKKSRAENLSIYRTDVDGKLFVAIRKGVSSTGMIVKRSGEVIDLDFAKIKSTSTTLSRLATVAIEDGLSLEEFINVLEGSFSKEQAIKEYSLQMEAKNANNA